MTFGARWLSRIARHPGQVSERNFSTESAVVAPFSSGMWMLAWRRLRADRVAMISLTVMALYFLLLLLTASGLLASDWSEEVAVNYAPPGFLAASASSAPVPAAPPAVLPAPENPRDPLRDILRQLRGQDVAMPLSAPDDYGVADPLQQELAQIRQESRQRNPALSSERHLSLPLGADKWGHDILKKTVKGAETSITVGVAAALLATALGVLLGAAAGYFGGWVDDCCNWFYSIFTAIPYLLLVLAIAALLQQKGTLAIVLILGLTGWTGTYRLMRAEYMKHKGREYVLAASAIGASHYRRIFVHIFPNVSHVALVQLSILVVGFIKSEVILSFLGFGVPVGGVSWGSMLNEAQNELILGKWWQMTAASIAMALLVTAFSLFTDALRDALDPKLR